MKFIISIILCFASLNFIKSQEANKILGYWLTENGKSQVKVFKATNGKYYGKIVWLKNPLRDDGTPKIDDKNPDPALKNKPLIGLQILNGFVYDEKKKEWNEGKIYDPESGNTYKCFIKFKDNNYNELYVKGYIGISLIGRETLWIRENSERK
jgi:uncharacterized protein (DUF2147 family)